MSDDFDELMEESTAKLTKAEKRAMRIANLNDVEWKAWKEFEIQKAEKLAAKNAAAKPKAEPEPSETDGFDNMELADHIEATYGYRPSGMDGNLSEGIKNYRKKLGRE